MTEQKKSGAEIIWTGIVTLALFGGIMWGVFVWIPNFLHTAAEDIGLKTGYFCTISFDYDECHNRAKTEVGAMSALGDKYRDGKDVPQSYKEAFKYYSKASKLGSAHSQLQLAILYENGKGTEKSDSKSFKWAKKSADQNNANAMAYLATKYYLGKGTKKNIKESYILISVGVALGVNYSLERKAKKIRKELEKVFSSDELDALQSEAMKRHAKIAKTKGE